MHDLDDFPGTSSRRSFLKLAGFSLGAAALTGCSRGLDTKAIPLLIQPEALTPGLASWYASGCGACPAGCGVLVKSRDGRPIKLEGNPGHPLNAGGLCAAGQASVLSLYDAQRLRGPLRGGEPAPWEEVDAAVTAALAQADGRAVRFLTGTIHSPTQRLAIDRFLAPFADAKHVMYDALSASALLDAHAEACGRRALPRFRFDRARLVVSLDADFLGTWISPVEFARAWRAGRDPDGAFGRHVQVESRLSLTGCRADERIVIAPDGLGAFLADLRAGRNDLGAELRAQPPGTTLVVCGSNDPAHQRAVLALNRALGNYGSTLELQRAGHQRLGDDRALLALAEELRQGKVGALFVAQCNPAYDLPGGLPLDRAGLVVSFAERVDETAAAAHFVCPDHHFLEAWSDGEPFAGLLTLAQPALAPLGATRALVESLDRWGGRGRTAQELVRECWRETVFPHAQTRGSFEVFWTQAVRDGFLELPPAGPAPELRLVADAPLADEPAEGLQLVLHAQVGMLDGRHAHNAWLHELPDPVTKLTWDNAAAVSPATAAALGVADGDVVTLDADGTTLELPVRVQPEQHDGVVAVALGYGRRGTDRFTRVGPEWIEGRPTVAPGGTVGANAAPLLAFRDGALRYSGRSVSVRPTGARHPLACTQLYDSLVEPFDGRERPLAEAMTLAAYRRGAEPAAPEDEGAQLWPDDHQYPVHHWGMVVDLAACTGCSACVVGCQAENNVPVVGRDEVRRQREMHWLRIDRYYGADGTVHQPMLCQHCDNAPCESVCPVLATVHSSEGLNQQVYNRCVGTRYCANNCPYKVRRFNWFDYPHEDKLANLALNPDVTVRMRGVMEKCTFCVQRIQGAKAAAKAEGRPLADGDVQPACVQSCPTRALVFGDTNDPASAVSRARKDRRFFRVLGELDVKPSVGYLATLRNREARHG